MKIIIDDKIPYIKGAFEPVAEVIYLAGSKTTPEVVRDAEAIVTRTRTICNENLLRDSSVKFIATATIGFDHIDTEFCKMAGIEWTNAPGCNAKSVEQYIASTLMVLAKRKNLSLNKMAIGVVGVGNVGSKVARFCELIGMKVLLNDPPRERAEGGDNFVSLSTIKNEADVITLHVPLNMKGDDSTYHLANDTFFDSLGKKAILINSCRGEVVKTEAVKKAIKEQKIEAFVCDCWENEPDLDLELLALTEIATPHIAGYSKDGKATGTLMSVQAIDEHFKLGLKDWRPTGVESPKDPFIELDGKDLSESQLISKAILHTYDIRNDDFTFRNQPSDFEKLRGDYPTRREFPAFTIKPKNIELTTIEKFRKMGFSVDI